MSEDDGTRKYWQTIRTMTTQVTESSIPVVGSFIDLDWSGNTPDEIEIRFDALTTVGAPAIVYFDIWRVLGSKIDRLYRAEYGSTEFTAPIPINLKFDAEQLYVTVSFSGGTTPNVTTVVQSRVIK